jgi:hypothetical protein
MIHPTPSQPVPISLKSDYRIGVPSGDRPTRVPIDRVVTIDQVYLEPVLPQLGRIGRVIRLSYTVQSGKRNTYIGKRRSPSRVGVAVGAAYSRGMVD